MYLEVSRAQKSWEDAVEAFLQSPAGLAMTHDFDVEMLKTLRVVLSALILPAPTASQVERRAIANHVDGLVRVRLLQGSIHEEWVRCAETFRERIRLSQPDLFAEAYVSFLSAPRPPPRDINIVETAELRIIR